MIILISPEETGKNEIDTLHQLFDAGLTHFHFRKPYASIDDHKAYLNQIDSSHHKHIMSHYFPIELTTEYNLKGIHLEEQKWRDQGAQLNPLYALEFRYEAFRCNKIWCFISFRIASLW